MMYIPADNWCPKIIVKDFWLYTLTVWALAESVCFTTCTEGDAVCEPRG